MRALRIISALALVVGFVQPVWSEPPQDFQARGIPGFLDPKTGTFKPMVQSSIGEDAAAVAPSHGTLVFHFTITIKSSIPTDSTITCEANTSVIESSGLIFLESAWVNATRSGSTATCTVNIPYSWALTTPSSDSIGLSYQVNAFNASNGPLRNSLGTLLSIKVPASGVLTTKTVAVTI